MSRHDCGGLFVFIGADAQTEWLPPEIARDVRGYVLTGDDVVKAGRWSHQRDPYLLESSVAGVFACGDVRLSPVKRVASAVGEGSMAVWDAVAKIAGKPLFQLLAERHGNGQANRKIFVYAAGGYYYPGQDHEKLKDEMRSYIDRGYTVVKKKIGGASLDEDLRRIDSILSVLQDGQKLAVDANGRFDLDTAIRYAKALSQYDLFWYEEAGDPLDFELQATLRNYYDKPMATGENLFSMQDARNLIRYGGMMPHSSVPVSTKISFSSPGIAAER